jgi:ABC-type nitrate/sulfonate/bicarbonate transport system substrate-binding protein
MAVRAPPRLNAEGSAHLLTVVQSHASQTVTAETMRLGYVPLTDAAPLLIAQEKGFFRRHGLSVSLEPSPSWASLRDRVAFGVLDGAQMLSPMTIAATLGLGGVQTDLIVAATLGRNGNTITISDVLDAELAKAGGLRAAIAARRDAGRQMPVLAVVFPFSSHNYLLRHWLAEAGIDPDHDIRLVVVPPPQVADALADGAIDGFCAGEPWGSRAVDLRVGRILLTTGDIWLHHPEKVLAFTSGCAEQDPDRLVACVAAVISAGAWLDAPENRAEAAHILTRALPTVPEQVIALALNGLVLAAPDSEPTPSPKLIFQRDGASYPFPEHGAWWLSQMRRWGHAPPESGLDVIPRIWRPDLWRRAASLIGEPVPVFDIAPPPPGVSAR